MEERVNREVLDQEGTSDQRLLRHPTMTPTLQVLTQQALPIDTKRKDISKTYFW